MTVQFTVAFKAVALVLIFNTYKNDCMGLLQKFQGLGWGESIATGMVEIREGCGGFRG